MIRQFLSTTVENLRSFITSLSGGARDNLEVEQPHPTTQPKIEPPETEQPKTEPVARPLHPPVDGTVAHAPAEPPAPARVSRPRRPSANRTAIQAHGTDSAPDVPHTPAEPLAAPPAPEPARVSEARAESVAEAAPETVPETSPDSDVPEADVPVPSAPLPPAPVPRIRTPRPAHTFPTQSVSAPVSSMPVPADASESAPESAPEQDAPIAPDGVDVATPPAETAPTETSPDGVLPAPPFASAPPFVEVHALLESLLFVAGEPVAASQLARTLEMDEPTVVAALEDLAQIYGEQNRGLRLQAHREKYQIVTAPAAANHIERFLNLDSSSKLSGPALETLAVVAYRQPVTRSQVEAVRGVDCAAVLRSLVQRGLVEEVGRLDVVGRPFLYGVTELFMQHFGLTDLGELPPLEQTEADTLWAATALAELEGETSADEEDENLVQDRSA
ncbi:MAG: SMC-Scp complex subunit ScpB [Litorilinea sp.]